MNKYKTIIIATVIVSILLWIFINNSINWNPKLSQNTAQKLVIDKWWWCKPDTCNELTVDIVDWVSGVWKIEAIYNGMYDDSIQATRKIATVHYINNQWVLWSVLTEDQKCQVWRWHQDFSEEYCI